MKKIVFTLLLLLAFFVEISANDGEFYVNGNEIIPINNTDIRVAKEILNIIKISDTQVAVSVYYEFFNPGNAKTIQVGFEALPPSLEVEEKTEKHDVPHPNIHQFSVLLNDNILPYTNRIKYSEDGYIEKYVYLFNANFKSGKNIVRHAYICDLSVSVMEYYSFYYVLDAAKRWAGGTIGDFTLNINMGNMQGYAIAETFFKDLSDWTMVGIGKIIDEKKASEEDSNNDSIMKCYIRQGSMVFHKKDFHPNRNLYIHCLDGSFTFNFDVFNIEKNNYCHLPFCEVNDINIIPNDYSFIPNDYSDEASNEFNERVIRNLPYARRGYVFKNKALKDFFNKVEWYFPDPNYKP